MKKTCILMLILTFSFLLTSCTFDAVPGAETDRTEISSSTNESVLTTQVQKLQRSVAGKFNLDQTPEEFLAALKAEGVTLTPNPNNPAYPDGRTVEWDDSFWYNTKNIRGFFNAEGKCTAFSVLTDKYPTEKSLVVGDSIDEMMDLYGMNYARDSYNLWYSYYEDDIELSFRIENDIIIEWDLLIPSLMSDEP